MSTAWQQRGKCEQPHDSYMAFVDRTKAFQAVNRNLFGVNATQIWQPTHFAAILHQFHTGMCAQGIMVGSQTFSFPADIGVKQGCVVAQIIFNLFQVNITLVSHRYYQPSDCDGVVYVMTKVSSTCGVSSPNLRLLQR